MYSGWSHVKLKDFYMVWLPEPCFLSFIRYVRKFNAKKIKESEVLFKENSVGFLPYFNTNRLPIHSEYKLYLER